MYCAHQALDVFKSWGPGEDHANQNGILIDRTLDGYECAMHAVVIFGWGEAMVPYRNAYHGGVVREGNHSMKYWWGINSWGAGWGMPASENP